MPWLRLGWPSDQIPPWFHSGPNGKRNCIFSKDNNIGYRIRIRAQYYSQILARPLIHCPTTPLFPRLKICDLISSKDRSWKLAAVADHLPLWLLDRPDDSYLLEDFSRDMFQSRMATPFFVLANREFIILLRHSCLFGVPGLRLQSVSSCARSSMVSCRLGTHFIPLASSTLPLCGICNSQRNHKTALCSTIPEWEFLGISTVVSSTRG